MEKRQETEFRFDHIDPRTVLTIIGKLYFTFKNINLNETFIGGLVASYEYGKNTNMGTFCGVEDEEYIEPETVCVTFIFNHKV